MDKLSSVPNVILSKIGHARVSHDEVLLHCSPGLPLITQCVNLTALLQLLPALQLATLTILIDLDRRTTFKSVGHMITMGSGWKELHVVTQDSMTLIDTEPWYEASTWLAEPVLTDWTAKLHLRDGRSSGASIRCTSPLVREGPCLFVTQLLGVLWS